MERFKFHENFEDEHVELAEWFFMNWKKILEIKWTGERDGAGAQKEREIGDLYRSKLRELRKKHSIGG